MKWMESGKHSPYISVSPWVWNTLNTVRMEKSVKKNKKK